MATAVKRETAHPKELSVISLVSSWAQQGVQTLFATQRILIDLAMRQNAAVVNSVREQLSDPHHSPTAILSDITGDGVKNFIEGQKVLLEMGKQQNEILMNGVKERIADRPFAHALTDLLRRSVETFIHMQEEYLKIAGKQTQAWLESAKAGKPYQPDQLVELTRESMENFVESQKRLLDVIADETAKATSGKHTNGSAKKRTELAELAQKATESFIEAQKKLIDLTGRHVNANMKTTGKTLELLRPFPFLPVSELTKEAVKSYVDAQKELMEVINSPLRAKEVSKPEHRVRKPMKKTKAAAA